MSNDGGQNGGNSNWPKFPISAAWTWRLLEGLAVASARDALSMLPIPVLGVDGSHMVVMSNLEADRLFGAGGSLMGEPLPALLAKADVAKGKDLSAKCLVCHNLEKGGANKVGPPLYGIVGRPTASVAGFEYSEALKNMHGAWTLEALNGWIANAATYAKGTKMVFQEADAGKRAHILAYLNSLSDSPAPLPK